MKGISLLGIILIVLGILTFVYQGITYNKQENIAQIGNIHVTANTQKTIYFPPIAGGFFLAAGVALVFLGRRKGR